MSGPVIRGLARFIGDPSGTLADLRGLTPALPVGLAALTACTLTMVVAQLAPGAVLLTDQPRADSAAAPAPFDAAALALWSVLGVAAALWLAVRLNGDERMRPAEAIWMTVPHALSLVVMQTCMAAHAVLVAASGGPLPLLAIPGGVGLIAFVFLVQAATVHALAPGIGWLRALGAGALALSVGQTYPWLALAGAGMVLILDTRRPAR